MTRRFMIFKYFMFGCSVFILGSLILFQVFLITVQFHGSFLMRGDIMGGYLFSLMRMPCEFFPLLSSNIRNGQSVPAKVSSSFWEGRMSQEMLGVTK